MERLKIWEFLMENGGFMCIWPVLNWDFVNQHVDLSNTPTQEWQECPTKIQYKNTNYYIYICTYIYNMLVQNVNAIGYSDISVTQTTHKLFCWAQQVPLE